MSEEPVIYTTLSQQKHTPKNNIKHKFRSNELPLTKEELKHQKSCKKWHKNRAEDVNGQGNSSPLPWRLISVVLGIMCLLLMAIATAVAVLTANSSSKQSSLTIQQKGLGCHSCPENWVWFRCSCYYFSKERLTWRESQRACSSLNSSLIKINREEMSTIMELASTGYGKMIRFCPLICFILLHLKKDNSVYLTNQEKFI